VGVRIGIDLGTTFSAVAWVNPLSGKAEIVPNALGEPITPSVVAITEEGKVLHGVLAKELREEGYTDTASFFKVSMGDPNYRLPLHKGEYDATGLSALLLEGLVREAQETLGQHIDGAVITCPAYFRDRERVATKEAGKKAGINVLSLLPEPTAAAFAYGLNQNDQEQTILIYDLGGGTFDVTVARISKDEITVLGTDGNHSLGGKNWDEAISRWIADKFEEEFGMNMLDSQEQISILTGVAENAKKRLTSAPVADISVFYAGRKGKYQLSLQEFNDITSYMLGETATIIERLFGGIRTQTGTLSWQDISGVIFVGGSTKMRMVSDYIVKMTGREPLRGVNVDEAVALGAAIRANQTADGLPQMSLTGTAKHEQGPWMIGSKKITDVASHALGMISVSEDGERYINDILIEKNAIVPCHRTLRRQLRVSRARANELDVYILQGSDSHPLHCDITGKYSFPDIRYVEGGQALIDITYKYDEDGIIEVSATQVDTGCKLHVIKCTEIGDMSWAGRSPKENVDTIPIQGEIFVVTDLSGSMMGRPLSEAKKAIRKFVGEIDLSCFKIGVMGVADRVKVYAQPSENGVAVMRSVDKMDIGGDCGGGNGAHPFDKLQSAFSRDAEVKVAIVLADGEWENKQAAIRAAQRCHQKDIKIIGLGFGTADRAFMEAISSEKDLATITNLGSLTTSFSNIAQVIGTRNAVNIGGGR